MPYITQQPAFIRVTESSTTHFFIALAFVFFISIAFWQIIPINFQFLILPNNKVLRVARRQHGICLCKISYGKKKSNLIIRDDGILYED